MHYVILSQNVVSVRFGHYFDPSCRNISCGSYPVNCPAEMTGDTYTANGIAYQSCPDCPASTSSSSTTVYSCTTRKCKITSCPSTQKLNSAGTACINKDDTCPTNYYKSCETGTQGEPKYTEAGTACYQCKPNIKISDCAALKQAIEKACYLYRHLCYVKRLRYFRRSRTYFSIQLNSNCSETGINSGQIFQRI